ncbi:WxL domain-containing protein [Enterococcus sp. AZ007]|uniref:WxL domain-containing protein n=1 Tax=Enterococcus sp. AZ007 TaxID=2774839 RepID=UPI003F29EFEB
MSKKKLVAGLLASASVLGICLSGGTALAAVQEEDTTVGIGFKDHTNPPPKGDLSIQWLPKALTFGEGHDVNTGVKAFDETSTTPKYVVINDGRAENGIEEWSLSAKLSKLVTSENHELDGAKLEFMNTKMAYDGGTAHPDTTNVVAARTEHTATILGNAGVVELDAGNATAVGVMQDKGDATKTSSYKGKTATQLSGIKLSVPGNKAVANKSYTGTVTWSLDDVIN